MENTPASALISDQYRALNREFHVSKKPFGSGGKQYLHKARYFTGTVLDYGCGKGAFGVAFKERYGEMVTNYDPAIPGWDLPPIPHDHVMCADVLEHVEPEYLDAVLQDLRRVTIESAYVVISTVKAHKVLPDGSNPHRIIESADWWREKLREYFVVQDDEITDKYAAYLS